MHAVVRAAAVYVFLLLVFRIAGKRTLKQVTVFDFVLLLIISEATQQALIGEDHSFTGAALVISTLVMLDVGLSLLKQRSRKLDKGLDDVPLILVADGVPLHERLQKERIDLEEVMEAARTLHGLERLEQVAYAVLERSGAIAIVPRKSPERAERAARQVSST
jgi:uncharacterized membrane protein YcaP (DUF421 family)